MNKQRAQGHRLGLSLGAASPLNPPLSSSCFGPQGLPLIFNIVLSYLFSSYLKGRHTERFCICCFTPPKPAKARARPGQMPSKPSKISHVIGRDLYSSCPLLSARARAGNERVQSSQDLEHTLQDRTRGTPQSLSLHLLLYLLPATIP